MRLLGVQSPWSMIDWRRMQRSKNGLNKGHRLRRVGCVVVYYSGHVRWNEEMSVARIRFCRLYKATRLLNGEH